MIKRIFFIAVITFACATILPAQKNGLNELNRFIKEIEAQQGYYDIDEEKGANGEVLKFYISQEDECYYNWSDVLDKHAIFFAEEIFGMSAMFNVRQDEEQCALFVGDKYALYVQDNSCDSEVCIVVMQNLDVIQNFDKVEMLRIANMKGIVSFGGLVPVVEDVEFVEIVSPETDKPRASTKKLDNGVVVLNESVEAHSDIPSEIFFAMFDYYMPKKQLLEEERKTADEERRKVIDGEIASIKKAWDDEHAFVRAEIEKLSEPDFVEVPCVGESYLATPLNTTRGIYDLISNTGFHKGVDGKNGQLSEIITPEVALLYYAARVLPKEQLLVDGYSETMKALFAQNFDGGTPAYLYRRSTDEEGYNTMKADLAQLFMLDEGEKYKGLKVTQRVDSDGKCFIQLYGNYNVVLLYDSPADKRCRMDVLVGGMGGFNRAANDCMIGGERGWANKCNIVIGCSGIRVVEGEYEKNGIVYSSGIHFETDYWNNLKK